MAKIFSFFDFYLFGFISINIQGFTIIISIVNKILKHFDIANSITTIQLLKVKNDINKE